MSTQTATLVNPSQLIEHLPMIYLEEKISTSEKIAGLQDIKKMVKNIHENSKDFSATKYDMSVLNNKGVISLNIQEPESPVGSPMSFSRSGFNSLCQRLEIPTSYLYKCLNGNKVDLAVFNMSSWLTVAKNPAFIVRSTNNVVHGVLTNKYSIFDDHEVLEDVENILNETSSLWTVKNYVVSPSLFKIRVLNREVVQVGNEKLLFGFDVNNSRTGASSLNVSFVIYRQVCKNGLIVEKRKETYYRRVHIGISKETFRQEFTKKIEQLPDFITEAVRSINNSFQTKISEDKYNLLIEQFRRAVGRKEIAADLEAKIRFDARADSLVTSGYVAAEPDITSQDDVSVETTTISSSDATEGVIAEETTIGSEISSGTITMTNWDLINIITNLAQNYHCETREKMEIFAGKLLK